MKDWLHLIRLALLFAAAAISFLVIRPFFVPATFGEFGHYRAAAMADVRARQPQFASKAECETCHSDVVTLQVDKKSRHARVGCQSCHGPLAAHVAGGGDPKPALPDVVPLCTSCHERTAGRPAIIPQVNSADHSGGEKCTTCHVAHAPGMQ